MAAQREYELVLMLDPGRDAPGRDAVAAAAKQQIEAGGTLKHENEWGLRKLAYEIARRTEADYRWFRFEAPPALLEQLDHNLKIAEGVLRFRIFKVDASAPVMAPPATSAPGPGASRERPPEPAPQPAETVSEAAEPAPEATEAASEPATAAAVAEPPAEATPERDEAPPPPEGDQGGSAGSAE